MQPPWCIQINDFLFALNVPDLGSTAAGGGDEPAVGTKAHRCRSQIETPQLVTIPLERQPPQPNCLVSRNRGEKVAVRAEGEPLRAALVSSQLRYLDFGAQIPESDRG